MIKVSFPNLFSIPQNNLNRCCYEYVYLIIFHGSTITGAVISDFVLQWSRGISFYHASIQHHSSPQNRFSKNEDKITKQQIKQLSESNIHFYALLNYKKWRMLNLSSSTSFVLQKTKDRNACTIRDWCQDPFFFFFLIGSSTDRIGKKNPCYTSVHENVQMFLWFSVCGYKGHKWQFHNNLKMHVYLNLL